MMIKVFPLMFFLGAFLLLGACSSDSVGIIKRVAIVDNRMGIVVELENGTEVKAVFDGTQQVTGGQKVEVKPIEGESHWEVVRFLENKSK